MTDPNYTEKRQRWRIIFAKKKEIKYISHLDLALAWERTLRRAQTPIAYSQGFNPRPKMQFASGLPLGTTGSAEIMDIIVIKAIEPTALLDRIRLSSPVGIGISSMFEVPLKSPTIQQLVRQAEYRVVVETDLPAETLESRIEALLAADKIIQTRIRRKKEEDFDLRPLLHALQLETLDSGDACLNMCLTAGQSGNLRPEAVLKALDLADNWAEIERTRLIFEKDL